MPKASASILINAPVAEVFDYTATFAYDKYWRTNVVDMKWSPPDNQGLGGIIIEVRQLFGLRREGAAEVIVYERNKRIDFQRNSGPIRPIGRYLYEVVPDGTFLTFELEVNPTGIWTLITPLVVFFAKMGASGMQKDFFKLKKRIEAEHNITV